MRSRLPVLLLSHGAALLAGWAAFTAWGKFHPRSAGAHDRRDDLLKLLILQDHSEILLNGDSRGPEWNAWVAGLTTDPAVPEAFRDHLIAQFSSPSDSLYHLGVPLDLQLKNPPPRSRKSPAPA